jgi:hypothetical protein
MHQWRRTNGKKITRFGWWALAIGPLVAACGAGEADGTLPFTGPAQAAPGEPVGVSTQALDGEGDRPVVASSPAYVSSGSGSVDYVLAIDTSGNLREMSYVTTYSPPNTYTPTFGTWSQIDSGLQGVPTMHVYPDTTAVDEYAWGADGYLWEYFRSSANGDIAVFNVSEISGFGKIAGSPVVVDWGDDSSEWAISVAVRRASDNALYTLDFTNGMGWQAHPVWNGSSVVKTDNTILSPNVLVGAGFAPYFAGRGVSSSDNATSWIANRANGNFGSSFTIYSSFTGSGSTPYTFIGPSDVGRNVIIARFGTQLKHAYAVQGSLQWTQIPNCSVAGSPGYNAIRGTNGHLLVFDFTNGCRDEGEVLTSAPSTWEFNEHLEFFRGSSGAIHAHQVGTSLGYSLHLSVP